MLKPNVCGVALFIWPMLKFDTKLSLLLQKKVQDIENTFTIIEIIEH